MLREVLRPRAVAIARRADTAIHGERPWTQFLVFATVGLGNVAIDAGVFALIVMSTGWREQPLALVASLIGFSAGAVHSYLWNANVTFRRSGRGHPRLSIGKFVVATAFAASLSAVLFASVMALVPANGMRLVLAKLVATLGSMVANFVVMRQWVFAEPGTRGPRSLVVEEVRLAQVRAASALARGRGRLRSSAARYLGARRNASTSRAVRPWGNYAVLETESDHQVKRLELSPGHRLSYQTHRFRSEHWYVVAGSGHAVLDGAIREIRPGQAVDVGIGVAHRLENTGDRELVIIEVQSGTYFGEDDIVRLDDDYGRGGGSERRDERADASPAERSS